MKQLSFLARSSSSQAVVFKDLQSLKKLTMKQLLYLKIYM